MVLQPTTLPVNADRLNVRLIPGSIVLNPLILVIKYHAVIHKVLSKIQLRVGADQLNVLLLVRIAMQMVIYAVILLLQYAVKKMVLQPIVLPVSVGLQNVLLIQGYSVSKQATVQEVVIKLLIQLPIQKLKVVHVVRYLEELVLRIKQRARLRQVI